MLFGLAARFKSGVTMHESPATAVYHLDDDGYATEVWPILDTAIPHGPGGYTRPGLVSSGPSEGWPAATPTGPQSAWGLR